jgi:hypothetical protein
MGMLRLYFLSDDLLLLLTLGPPAVRPKESREWNDGRLALSICRHDKVEKSEGCAVAPWLNRSRAASMRGGLATANSLNNLSGSASRWPDSVSEFYLGRRGRIDGSLSRPVALQTTQVALSIFCETQLRR